MFHSRKFINNQIIKHFETVIELLKSLQVMNLMTASCMISILVLVEGSEYDMFYPHKLQPTFCQILLKDDSQFLYPEE